MKYVALGVDQSPTNTGWAMLKSGDAQPTWGRYSLPAWADNEGRFLWQWFSWLGRMVTDHGVTHMWLEHTFNPNDHHESLTERIGQYGLIGMADVVRYLCTEEKQHPLVFELITTQQWRPKWIGTEHPPKGLVKHQRRAWLKEKSINAAAARGWLCDSDDEADALGIMSYGVSQIDLAFGVKQGPLWRRSEAAVDNERRTLNER